MVKEYIHMWAENKERTFQQKHYSFTSQSEKGTDNADGQGHFRQDSYFPSYDF